MSVNKVNQSDGSLAPIAGATIYADEPIGTILPFGGSTIPDGFLLCNGAAISRTTYADLFAVIGTQFGSGDGSTTFNIPDLRESVPKGAGETGQTVGAHVKSGGLAVGEFIDDRLQTHAHNTYLYGSQKAGADSWAVSHDYTIDNGTHTSPPETPARIGVTTEVKAVGVNYIIKATSLALPTDFEKIIDSKIPKYACGEETVNLSATTATNVTITFPPGKFTSIPIVTATLKCQNMQVDNYNAWREVSVIMKPDFTVTGGTIVVLNASSQALPVLLNWIAIN